MAGTRISVIIPCYNHGIYLGEALESFGNRLESNLWEVIIVNDGSSDEVTLEILRSLEDKGIHVIHQQNKGLAAARNAGIAAAVGEYVLLLDADNKLEPEVFERAANLMDGDKEVAMVYTDFINFGERNGYVNVFDKDLFRLLARNYIDACILVKKDILEKIGGYDTRIPFMGNEDWDIALNLYANNYKVLHLKEAGFYYRVRNNSMYATITSKHDKENRGYLFQKYPGLVSDQFVSMFKALEDEKAGRSFAEHRIREFKIYLKKNRFKAIIKILIGKPFSF